MSSTSSDGTTPSNIRSFPPRKPRLTAQDHEDMAKEQRLLQLRYEGTRLLKRHGDLHNLFAEVVRAEDEWPFFLVHYMKTNVGQIEFDMMTKNPNLLEAARESATLSRARNTAKLSKALLEETGLTITTLTGEDFLAAPRLLKGTEAQLEMALDLNIDKGGEKTAVDHLIATTHMGLRTMIDNGGELSDITKARLQQLKQPETPPLSPRARHMRMAEHWLVVSKDDLELMKLNLLADYADRQRSEKSERVEFDGVVLAATPPQRDFIQADSHGYQGLTQVGTTLHRALTH